MTSYVHSPWPLTWLCLKVGGVAHTLNIAKCEKWNGHIIQSALVWCIFFYSSRVDHWEVFSNLPIYVSNHLFSLWCNTVWIQVLIILHRMSKYILSDSFIDQQYRTLCKTCIMKDQLWKKLSESVRSIQHQFHCRRGSIFLEGGVCLIRNSICV